jgi:hypothetical protein
VPRTWPFPCCSEAAPCQAHTSWTESTINFSAPLRARLQALAVAEGTTLKAVVADALSAYLKRAKASHSWAHGNRAAGPLGGSRSLAHALVAPGATTPGRGVLRVPVRRAPLRAVLGASGSQGQPSQPWGSTTLPAGIRNPLAPNGHRTITDWP